MKRIRVIPVLLMHNNGLVKSERFKNYRYVGDPINAVKIFNDKEVDELALIDITATKDGRQPNVKRIKEIASEAFMPLSYGGGITTLEQASEILSEGAEKVILNRAAYQNPALITAIAKKHGTQSTVVSIDVKKDWLGIYKAYTENGKKCINQDLIAYAKRCEHAGAGEILLNSINRDGTFKGYDTEMIGKISTSVSIPVIAAGGAAGISDFKDAVIIGKASAVAAGSYFVFQRPHKAVLINYPSQKELEEKFYSAVYRL